MPLTIEQEVDFCHAWDTVAADVHRGIREAGFWESANFGEKLALVHSELSEALEGLRAHDRDDDHLPGLKNVAVELADAVIRIMDLAKGCGYDVASAIVLKHAYNQTRSPKHGKAF